MVGGMAGIGASIGTGTGALEWVEIVTCGKAQRRYSDEKKVQLVTETFQPGKTVTGVLRRHGIRDGEVDGVRAPVDGDVEEASDRVRWPVCRRPLATPRRSASGTCADAYRALHHGSDGAATAQVRAEAASSWLAAACAAA